MISYGKQNINNEDILSVVKTLKSDFLTTGPKTLEFENNFRNKVNSKYAATCSNGTAAIYLSLLALNIKKGDVVILPVINFIASLNMLENLSAKVFLTDVDRTTGQMTPQNLLDCIKKNKLKKIKAVITMYNGGDTLNAENFYKIKKKYKFFILEDACHALGAKYYEKNRYYVGSCKYSDICTFSFHPVKTITTCEGGMITTNNKKIYDKIKIIRNHGMVRRKSSNKNFFWKYKILYPGFNFRLSDVNCALGISQLKRLDKFVRIRNKIAKKYRKKLSSLSNYLKVPNNKNSNSAFHLYIINIDNKKIKVGRDRIIQLLYKFKIMTQVHYIPVNKHPYYKKYSKLKFIGAKQYFNSCLSLPIYVDLSERQINFIYKKLFFLINKYKRK